MANQLASRIEIDDSGNVIVTGQSGHQVTAGPGVTSSSGFPIVSGKSAYVPSTGVAATDTAAIQAAHDAFGANGGTIYLDPGPYVLTGGGVDFTKAIHLIGTGPNGTNSSSDSFLMIGTTIQCASSSANAITVDTDGCTFEKLFIQNTSSTTPTAGAGIQFVTHGKNFRILDCCVTGFWTNIDVLSGYYWMIDRCAITNPVKWGVHVADALGYDAGDQTITNTLFTPGPLTNNSSTAIVWTSGGGLRVTNCKVNNSSLAGSGTFQTAYAAVADDGITTADLFICNNSFENTTFGIIITDAGPNHTGKINNIIIANNEIATSGSGNTDISINPTNGPFDKVEIIANVMTGGTATIFANVTNMKLHGMAYPTASRPSASLMGAGSWYYDTTLHKPGFADGSGNWKDAAGTNI